MDANNTAYKSWAEQVEEEEEMEEVIMLGPPILPIHDGIFFSII